MCGFEWPEQIENRAALVVSAVVPSTREQWRILPVRNAMYTFQHSTAPHDCTECNDNDYFCMTDYASRNGSRAMLSKLVLIEPNTMEINVHTCSYINWIAKIDIGCICFEYIFQTPVTENILSNFVQYNLFSSKLLFVVFILQKK